MHDIAAVAIPDPVGDGTQIVEGATEIEIGDVDVPEPRALAEYVAVA
jgi:hypothetical protein